jgi:NADP-dependent 3-hydroxy acid dehydrogenase YdfG
MDGLGKSMRLELMDKGVRVTNVYPGATYTDSWASSDLPKSRFMQADDIAKSILNAYNINEFSDVEEIVIRPILGDI